jgi:nitroreductase
MNPATTDTAIHPLLASRRSPRAFDPGHVLDDAALTALLEAARWAPSSTNSQPWRFLVGRRGDEVFTALERTLAAGNRLWAPQASALLLVAVEATDPDGRPRRHAAWDAGQAVALLTVQAEAEGLAVRQMAGFSPDAARAALAVPDRYEPMTVVAVGRPLPPDAIPDEMRERELAPRVRKPLEEVAFSRWGQPLGRGA